MTLPQDLQYFIHPTLVVLGDHVQARLWLASNPTLTVVDGFSERPEFKSDREGSFVNTDHGSVSAPEPKGEQERLRHLLKDMAEHIETQARKHEVQHIHLVMKKDLMNELERHMGNEIRSKINRRLDEDLMKDDILDVLRRMRQR